MLICYIGNEIHILQNPDSYFGRYWRHCLLKDQSEACNYSEWIVPADGK